MTEIIKHIYLLYCENHTVTTDSRKCPKGSIFFALHGDKFDGNLFASKALEAGAAYAVIDKPEFALDKRYIVVPNTLYALQQLAAEHRNHLKIPIVGITGTNGKTTTKELIATILSSHFHTTATQGNLNNHIGVPLSLLSIPTDCQVAVIEMGANHPGEIATLAAIVRPTIGLITNVGKAHLEGFGSLEGVLKTKAELYDEIKHQNGTIIINAADKKLKSALGNYNNTVTYSASPDIKADINGFTTKANPFVNINFENHNIETQFIGTYNTNNILAAIAVGTKLGVPQSKIIKAIHDYTPGNNRSQLMKTQHNTLIVDAYNANPTSMTAAIVNFAQIQANNKIAILGDMLELGNQSEIEHKKIVKLLQSYNIQSILIGNEFAKYHAGYTSLPDSESLSQYLKQNPINKATILLKGSNGIGLQKNIQDL